MPGGPPWQEERSVMAESEEVPAVYALWVGLAFFAAFRTAGGRAIYTPRGR